MSSTTLLSNIRTNKIIIKEHVDSFVKEMEIVKVSPQSKFMILGNTARVLSDEYYEKHFPHYKVFYLQHYAGRGTDKEWLENILDRPNVTELNFEEELEKYKNEK